MTFKRKVVLYSDIPRHWCQALFLGVVKYARVNGPWLFYGNTPFDIAQNEPPITVARILDWGAEAVVLHSLDPRLIRGVADSGLPCVLRAWNKRVRGSIDLVSDNVGVGRMAAEYFLEQGFRKFGFVGFDGIFWSNERRDGFVARLAEEGYPVFEFRQSRLKSQRLWENEQKALATWILGLPKPVCILACLDDRGRNVLEACMLANCNVPEEVAVLGVDDEEMVCELTNPPMSSIGRDFDVAGVECGAQLDRLMAGEKPENLIVTVKPTRVVPRQSTSFLAIPDRDVASAITYIRSNPNESLGVDDVLEHVGGSRRGLELRFRKALGRTIYKEIQRIRVEKLCIALLEETDMSVYQIADNMKFASPEHMTRMFTSTVGVSPAGYRKKKRGL